MTSQCAASARMNSRSIGVLNYLHPLVKNKNRTFLQQCEVRRWAVSSVVEPRAKNRQHKAKSSFRKLLVIMNVRRKKNSRPSFHKEI